jgi:hypothetical protein
LNTYNVTLKYEDRNVGSEGRTIKVDASSIAGAIGKATREATIRREQRVTHRGCSGHHWQRRSYGIRRDRWEQLRGK